MVSWTPVSGATAYDLGRLVAPGGWQRVGRVAGGDTSYIDRGRDLTQSHRYRVVAIVGNLASLPALSNELTEPAAGATGGGATPSSATSPTPSSDTARVTTAARCSTHGSAPGRQFCSSDRIDWGPTLSKDIFITASCPEGYALVTGGHDTLLWGSSELRSSGPSGNGWQLWVQARSDPNRPAMSFARATALCERR